MVGRPKIEIAESVEELQELLKKQRRILEYNKVWMLYILQSKQLKTVREVARILGKGEATIHRWLSQYRDGGIENLLRNRQTVGRPKKVSVETAAKVQQELRDKEGFSSYKEIHFWLKIVEGISVSYATVYNLVRGELKSKLKTPRPRSAYQRRSDINEFKKNLSEKINKLISKASKKLKKYSRVSFWCGDEARIGMHTIKRQKITLSGVKPQGIQQYNFDYFWLYGLVEPLRGRSFFFEFSHLDKICFSQYLSLVSQAYPEEILIIQIDNAPCHTARDLEIPENILLLFQPPYCPEVNPAERVWEYLKEFLAWQLFINLDELRDKVNNILCSLTHEIIGHLTGWSWILHSLSLSQL